MKRFAHWIAIAFLVAAVLLGQQFGLLKGEKLEPKRLGDLFQSEETPPAQAIDEDGRYDAKDEVALYINTYGRLPGNYITKAQAAKLGFDNRQTTLDQVAPGQSIGGDRFGNYEGLLPAVPGRTWRECDIDYRGGTRGAKRIVFSSDGLIYYTADHYKTFERLN